MPKNHQDVFNEADLPSLSKTTRTPPGGSCHLKLLNYTGKRCVLKARKLQVAFLLQKLVFGLLGVRNTTLSTPL